MSPGAPCSTSATSRPRFTPSCSSATPTACRDGELFLAYPVPGRNNETQPGQRAYNVVWYRPTRPEKLADLCTDATGKCHGTTIAPPLIRPDVIAWIKAQARELVAPQVAEIMERDPRPFFQPIFDLDSPQIVFGRVALLGDAAFVGARIPAPAPPRGRSTPRCWPTSIAAHGLDAGLALYQRRQRAFGSGIVQLGRKEGAYLSDQLKPRADREEQAASWPIEDLMHSHNTRSEALRKVLDDSLRAAAI